jgi:hypothetical protein
MLAGAELGQRGLLERGRVGDGDAAGEQAGGAPQAGVDGVARRGDRAGRVHGQHEVGVAAGTHGLPGDGDQVAQRLRIGERVTHALGQP